MEEVCKSLDRDRLARFVQKPFVQRKHRWVPAFPGDTSDIESAVCSSNAVRGLLGAGLDLTLVNVRGMTPLALARHGGFKDVVHFMVSEHDELVRVLGKWFGRAPTQMEIYGVASLDKMHAFRQRLHDHINSMTPKLINAARGGDLVTVKTLLESDEIGANVVDPATDETAFSAALAHDHRAVLTYLMENGAKMHGVCHIDGKRHSVLSATVRMGDVSFVRRVVAYGAAVVPAGDSTTNACALVEAAKLGSIEMVQTLRDLGVRFDRTQRDLQLPTPFRYHILGQECYEPPVNTDVEPWLLSCIACWFRDHTLLNRLINKYPVLQDQRAKPEWSSAVLFYAVYRESEACVMELFERSASIDTRSEHATVFAAVMAKSTRMLELLLERTSDVSAETHSLFGNRSRGESALSISAYLGDQHCVALLLPLDTRPQYRDRALVWAIIQGHFEVVTLLLDAGRPLTAQRLGECVSSTTCPVMLDLLLSRCCGDDISIHMLTDQFERTCSSKQHADLLAVYIAHGFDINHGSNNQNITSWEMYCALNIWDTTPSPSHLWFILEHGIPSSV